MVFPYYHRRRPPFRSSFITRGSTSNKVKLNSFDKYWKKGLAQKSMNIMQITITRHQELTCMNLQLGLGKPTLHFFQNGKKASEVIGADVEHLRDTMEALYK
ncbi:unnamed protein product [Fraxinus pennsylvanica]|uniref:Thioredoxin domain-containing protein n=1 Tax=Fraxinus pennsylvanica TaxID=56036 RepID=A0AAD2A726_9LAMI|nr:unnamed protein product [Fraxinus pennsylvanica]